ncbi:hypothetical protein ACLB2K_053557 [Fragaria x ananassa]
MAVSMSASIASMTTRLISKLSHSNQDEPVDLGNIRYPKKGFVVLRCYLIHKLNTTRLVTFDSFKSAVRSMWRLSTLVEVQVGGDRFLFTFTNERDAIRVKKGGQRGYQRAMILLNDYDVSNIMVVPLDFVWIWVEIQDCVLGWRDDQTGSPSRSVRHSQRSGLCASYPPSTTR